MLFTRKTGFCRTICFIGLLIFCFLPIISKGQAASLRIDFFSPAIRGDTFWDKTELFMKLAAEDLNIDLHVHRAGYDRILMANQLKQVLSAPEKTDGIIFQSLKKNGLLLIKLAEQHRIPAIIFNAGLDDESISIIGTPRQVYQYWIGELLPDDEDAGYQLAVSLIRNARQMKLYDQNRKINLFGIMGAYAEGASRERVHGFKRALKENLDVNFYQLVQGYWKKARAKPKVKGMFNRYPETHVIWSANDPMAIGAIEAAEERGRRPGKDLLVGGVDWTDIGIQAIKDKKMAVSFGGHFMDGAWALVWLYDYLNGKDFVSEATRVKSRMFPITRDNLDQYKYLLNSKYWTEIDFGVFSKVKNPRLKHYDFSIQKVVRQFDSN